MQTNAFRLYFRSVFSYLTKLKYKFRTLGGGEHLPLMPPLDLPVITWYLQNVSLGFIFYLVDLKSGFIFRLLLGFYSPVRWLEDYVGSGASSKGEITSSDLSWNTTSASPS